MMRGGFPYVTLVGTCVHCTPLPGASSAASANACKPEEPVSKPNGNGRPLPNATTIFAENVPKRGFSVTVSGICTGASPLLAASTVCAHPPAGIDSKKSAAIAAALRCRYGSRSGPHGGVGQNFRTARRLVEIEICAQIAELRRVFAHVGTAVGAAIGFRIDALAVEEVVFNELHVGVVTQRLMIDKTTAGVRTDHDARHPNAVAVLVH